MPSLYDDYKVLGDVVYDRFNANRNMQTWYYGELLKVFEEYKENLSVDPVDKYTEVYTNIFGAL